MSIVSCEGKNHEVVFGGRSKKIVLEWRWKEVIRVSLSGVGKGYRLCT